MSEHISSLASRLGGGESDSLGEAGIALALRGWWVACRPQWTDPGWFDAPLVPAVRELLGLPLGGELLSALTRLEQRQAGVAAVCPGLHEGLPGLPSPGSGGGVPCACQVVVAAAWEAMTSWTSARAARALVAAVGPQPVEIPPCGGAPGVTDPGREELAPALRLSPAATGLRITAARDLLAQPELLELVTVGGCSLWAARGVLAETANLSPAMAGLVVHDVTERVRARAQCGLRMWTATEVRRAARAARLKLGSAQEAAARECAHRGRKVAVHHGDDGMATLVAVLPEVDAHRIHSRLSALAHGLDDPQRSTDQKRADILVDVLLAAGPTEGSAVGTGGGKPEISVVASLATVLGLVNDPGEVPGLGAIPAEVVRELAAEGRWRLWVTDAAGQVTATGTRGYTPTPALARLIRAREPHCRMPGCRRQSTKCDLDHTIPYPTGPTQAANLGPLCRRHHIQKTHYHHDITNETEGWTWTTPAGVTHHDHPDGQLGT